MPWSKGDGDVVWAEVLADCVSGSPKPIYEGGRIDADQFSAARWDLMPRKRYMWASVQTVRGCPKHCSFCSVWRTDGQKPRQRPADAVVEEIVQLRRQGFRFIALADDNFYPVTLTDLELAGRQKNKARLEELKAIRAERFELMARLAQLPKDMVFYTQITMEAAEDDEFLDAMKSAHILGALVGVEAVTPDGLEGRLQGLQSLGASAGRPAADLPQATAFTCWARSSSACPATSPRPSTRPPRSPKQADLTFAQFVMLTPFPGTVDFAKWEKTMDVTTAQVNGIPLTRHWLIPQESRPKYFGLHPTMSADEMRQRTQAVWDKFYSFDSIWKRSRFVKSLKARAAFVLISKIYRQMYANTGITTDSARMARSTKIASWLAKPCRLLFAGRPMPDLEVPPSPGMYPEPEMAGD